ncbi:hypothetical protein QQZ08_003647 [Neonectria magnoliae]|uniref:Uncharacterized protein n=1 Tax=Neonectria magnoliae TaxID=2732573 RepID=A0ABR1IA69_9HYPO
MADPTAAAFVAHDAISVQEAAQKLAAPARDAFEKDGDLDKVEQELNRLWSAVLDAAEQTSHDQQAKLVDIVRAIQQMPQPVHAGKKFEIWDQEQRWDLLPLFGAQARERLDTAQEKPGDALVNVHAFFARLTAAGINDLSLFAIWAFREALEDPEKDQVAKTTSAELLQSVSVWLIYAAEALSKKSKDAKQFDGKMAKPGRSLSAFKDAPGWMGFCQERWETWIQRLTPLKEAEVATEAKSLISQAVDNACKV